jgi:S-adenosylmethionine:tRNA ribosyltransferase-isomerase
MDEKLLPIEFLIDYDLPNELVAQTPASPRDHARLLVYNRSTKQITDAYFYQLNEFLPKDATLVLNNSRVEKCRLLFGDIEIFVLERLSVDTVVAMVRPGNKFRVGFKLNLPDGICCETLQIDDDGFRKVRFNMEIDSEAIQRYSKTPLPPYIAQNDAMESEYQTVFAKTSGSLAAPTAGLHFTPELLNKTKLYHDVLEITLHVGLGTFAKIRPNNFAQNKLHSEEFYISEQTAERLTYAKHITAVGTTTCRALESACDQNGYFHETNTTTDIFIKTGYSFRAVNSMITNFHLPSTSLMLMVATFFEQVQDAAVSRSEILRVYNYAVAQKYRFYSFGDAMLIL